MTEDRLPLAELLAKTGDGDFLRGIAEAVVQSLTEIDVEGLIRLVTMNVHVAARLSQWVSRPDAGHAARCPSVPYPEAAAGELLAAPGAPENLREAGFAGHPAGLD